jgi:hypothetical protein
MYGTRALYEDKVPSPLRLRPLYQTTGSSTSFERPRLAAGTRGSRGKGVARRPLACWLGFASACCLKQVQRSSAGPTPSTSHSHISTPLSDGPWACVVKPVFLFITSTSSRPSSPPCNGALTHPQPPSASLHSPRCSVPAPASPKTPLAIALSSLLTSIRPCLPPWS